VSALDLLDEAKALPARERKRLLLALLKLDTQKLHSDHKPGQVNWPDVEARAKSVFGERIFPNVVLLERQEENS
jgi:hypothetical protein